MTPFRYRLLCDTLASRFPALLQSKKKQYKVLKPPSLFWKLGVSALSICILGLFGEWGDQYKLSQALAPAVTSMGSAARLYFAGPCAAVTNSAGPRRVYPVFPSLALERSPVGASGTDAVREVLRNEPNVVVTVNTSGLTNITIGDVPMTYLNTKIHQLTLNQSERWEPFYAIRAIEGAGDAGDSLRALNMHTFEGPSIIDIIMAELPGDERAAHLPPVLKDVTIDQALDLLAKTFRQLVSYGVCTQDNGDKMFWLDSTPLSDCADKIFGLPSCVIPDPHPIEVPPLHSPTPVKPSSIRIPPSR